MRSLLPKLPTLQNPVFIPIRTRNGSSMPVCRHAALSPAIRCLHIDCHTETRLSILGISPGFWIAKKHEHCISDKLIDGTAMSEGNFRHFREIIVQKPRNLFWLKTLRNPGDILYV